VHGHDFPEVFWIARGRGTHLINGSTIPLKCGTLVCVRARDTHGFISDENGILVHNVAISPVLLRQIKRRYFPQNDVFWNLKSGDCPCHHQIHREGITELNRAFEQLSASDCTAFHGERFLLNLLFLIHDNPQPDSNSAVARHPDIPDWLAHALMRWLEDPGNFLKGTPALAKLAGRSPEHVARVLRQASGKTPTNWLNEARMGYAAKQLRFSNRKILEIAMDCGFSSLGHFYAVFEQAHGCPPRSYRLRYLPRPI
jgi:AraC family transcriptional regulator, dual regulator of chb operon